jgi:hypothetical protein
MQQALDQELARPDVAQRLQIVPVQGIAARFLVAAVGRRNAGLQFLWEIHALGQLGRYIANGGMLGAKMVLIGRSTLYGTAAAGEAGATRALDIYCGEISRAMAQISCNSVAEIGPQHVALQEELLTSEDWHSRGRPARVARSVQAPYAA